MKSTLARLGAEPRGGTPQDLADRIAAETRKWKPIVQALNFGAEVNEAASSPVKPGALPPFITGR